MAQNRDSGFFYGYVIVGLVFCVMLVSWGIFLSFGVFFEPMLTEFGWTRAATSAAYSISIIVSGVLGIITGKLTDRFGPRLVMTGSGFLLGSGYLLMSQVNSIWQLYLFFGLIVGLGMSATFVPANSVITRWFVRRRGTMTGIVLAGNSVGILFIPHVVRWLISAYGWRISYIGVGIIALVIITVVAQFLKRDPGQTGQVAYGADEVKAHGLGLEVRGYSLQAAVHTRQLWLLSGMSFIIWLCVGIIMVHIVIHATGLGLSITSATNIMVTIGVASIIGKIGMGNIADRIGNKAAFIISFGIMSASFFWVMVSQEEWMLYLFGGIFGFAYGALSPLMSPIVAELFGLSSHGAIFGFTFLMGEIGEAIGPVVAGGIFDVTGSYQWAFIFSAVISILGIALSSLVRPTSGKSPSTLAVQL